MGSPGKQEPALSAQASYVDPMVTTVGVAGP